MSTTIKSLAPACFYQITVYINQTSEWVELLKAINRQLQTSIQIIMLILNVEQAQTNKYMQILIADLD